MATSDLANYLTEELTKLSEEDLHLVAIVIYELRRWQEQHT